MSILLMLAGLTALFVPVTLTDAHTEVAEPPIPQVVLLEVLPTIPEELKRIADCESGKRDKNGRAIAGTGTHYDSAGNVIIGRLNRPELGVDIGKYQVNEVFHTDSAEELGLDLYDAEDNEKYALKLYKEQGNKPWLASQNCWSSQ